MEKTVALKQNKQIFTMLGSGSAVPQLNRGGSSALLQADDNLALVDAGRGCINRLLELGLDPADINHICLTHFHPDHSVELVSLVFGRYNNPGRLWTAPLEIMGGPGLTLWWGRLMKAWPGLRKPYDKGLVRLREMEPGARQACGAWHMEALAVNHKPESLAYKFLYNGHSVAVSGDTGPAPGLAPFALNAGLLVLDCAAGFKAMPGHLNIYQAATIALAARPQKLLLTHFFPDCDCNRLNAAFGEIYQNPFQLAFDLLQMEV